MRIIAYGLALTLALSASSAGAHSWFSGKTNPKTGYGCCGGSDCVVIEQEDWWLEGERYFVKWRDGKTYEFPAGQVLPTQDPGGKAAACVWGNKMQCLFVPLSF